MLATLLLADAVHKYSPDQPRAANGEFGEGEKAPPTKREMVARAKELTANYTKLSAETAAAVAAGHDPRVTSGRYETKEESDAKTAARLAIEDHAKAMGMKQTYHDAKGNQVSQFIPKYHPEIGARGVPVPGHGSESAWEHPKTLDHIDISRGGLSHAEGFIIHAPSASFTSGSEMKARGFLTLGQQMRR